MSCEEVSLIFKVSDGNKFTLALEKKISIKEAKEKLAEPSNIPSNQQRLIYKGRILKDNDKICDLNVENGHTMHLVKSSGSTITKPSQTQQNTTDSDDKNSNPSLNASIPVEPASLNTNPDTQPNINQNDSFVAMMSNLMNTGDFGSLNNTTANNDFTGTTGNIGNPANFASLMNSPMFQQSMSELANNPQLIRSLLRANPMFNQLTANNPMINQMLENPEMLRMMLNPQLIQNILQTQNSAVQNTSGQTNTLNNFNLPNQGGFPDISQLSNILNDPSITSLLSGNAGYPTNNTNIPPSEMFATQLNQLRDMGFIDNEANIWALQQTGGDVNAAINRLLERGIGQ